jgi:small-conductance mechanosensitive channel
MRTEKLRINGDLSVGSNELSADFSDSNPRRIIPSLLHDLFNTSRPLGALTVGILILIAAIFFAKLLGIWSRRLGQHPQPLVDPTVVSYLGRLLQVVCYIVAAIIYAHLIPSLQRLGETMLASAGLVSLVIGLAAQNTLGNVIAGFSLLLYRPFAIGDTLTLNTPSGAQTAVVKEFTLGYTRLMTEDNRWIIVPNSVIASNIIIRVK